MPSTGTGSLLNPDQVIARCRVIRFLGAGGMGEVYLCEHLSLHKQVALKVLPPPVDHLQIDRFLREARLASQIEDPNVVTIHDVGRQGSLYYILMQYVEGKDLVALVKAQKGPLPWRTAVKLLREASKGAGAVHHKGLIHRDIKPANIMVSNTGRVLLMDFGLAREQAQSDLTMSGAIAGTPVFMSPEQCRGSKDLDKRSDIVALGGTLYFLLTAKLPYQGDVVEVLTQIKQGKGPRPVHAVNPAVPREVSDIVAKAMAHDPRQRFQDAKELVRELIKVGRVPDLPATVSYTGETAGNLPETRLVEELAPLELIPEDSYLEKARRHTPWIVAGAAVLCVLLVLAFFLNRRPEGAAAKAPPMPSSPTPVAEKKGMVFIKAGTAAMGNDSAKLRQHYASLKIAAQIEDDPRAQVHVPGFWIDKYEVTNADYGRFVKDTNHPAPSGWSGPTPPPGLEQHPVVQVRHADAIAYAAWAKKKLPTAEQWVRAFRGDKDTFFPWGDEWKPDWPNVAENRAFPGTSAVTATPEDLSPFGVCNLVGNVKEMIRDLKAVGGNRVVVARGGDWSSTGAVFAAGAVPFFFFDPNSEVNPATGFRCVIEEP